MDPRILLGINPPNIESPVNALARVEDLRGRQQRNMLAQVQMQQAQREMAQQEQEQNLLARYRVPENRPGDGVGPTREAGFDAQGYGNALMGVNPMKALQMRQLLAKEAPKRHVIADGGVLADDNGKLLFENQKAPKEPPLPPNNVREYEYAKQQGYKGTFEQWDRESRKAGAGNTNLHVNTAKPLLNEVAGGLGKQIDATLANARAAQGSITTAHNLMQAIDTGKIVAGPGSSFRVLGLQMGQMLGVGGNDAAETLANTRSAIQSMAQAELDAAQQMKGQGQITEAERDIIRRAASGNIDAMTGPEIRLLAGTMEKTARSKIKSHRSNVDALRKLPDAAPLLPFYDVPDPPAYGGANRVRKYNPATGKIE